MTVFHGRRACGRMARASAAMLLVLGAGFCGAARAADDLSWVGGVSKAPSVVLSDDFSGDRLDRSKWCTRYQHAGGPALQIQDPECLKFGAFGNLDYLNNEQQRYVDINRQGVLSHRVSDGILHLTATKTLPGPHVLFESAMIRSKLEFRPTEKLSYVFVAKVRLPRVRGTWPAIWIAPGINEQQKTAWPPEIDLMEGALNNSTDTHDKVKIGAQAQNWGGKAVSDKPTTLTYSDANFDTTTRRYRRETSLRGTWVEFAAYWKARSVCYYVDRVKVACESYEWIDNDRKPAPAGPIMLNLGIGGAWAGADGIDEAAFPASYDIDFVRVYGVQAD